MAEPKSRPFAPGVRERAVRLVVEHQEEYEIQLVAIRSIAETVACSAEALRSWNRRAERDAGRRPGPTSDERERLEALARGNRALERANDSGQ